MKLLKRSSRGQVMIAFGAALVGVLAAIALCTDVSVMYANWQSMQKAVDSAALAGANDLPNDPVGATSTAQIYAESNGLKPSEVTVQPIAAGATTITVIASRSVPYYFGRVVGLSNQLIQVTATASEPAPIHTVGGGNTTGSPTGPNAYGTSTGQYPLIPIGLEYTTVYNYNQPVTLNQGSVGPGDWGSLALGGVGGANLRSNVADGYSGPVSVGDWITTEPGKKVGPIDQGFSDRMSQGQSQYPDASFSSHTLDDPRAVVVPLVDWSTAQGRGSVLVKGFAMLWIDSVNGGQIQAHFIQQVVPDSLPDSQATDYGAHGVPVLIK
jgi:Flp pilus assembly protein TadG